MVPLLIVRQCYIYTIAELSWFSMYLYSIGTVLLLWQTLKPFDFVSILCWKLDVRTFFLGNVVLVAHKCLDYDAKVLLRNLEENWITNGVGNNFRVVPDTYAFWGRIPEIPVLTEGHSTVNIKKTLLSPTFTDFDEIWHIVDLYEKLPIQNLRPICSLE